MHFTILIHRRPKHNKNKKQLGYGSTVDKKNNIGDIRNAGLLPSVAIGGGGQGVAGFCHRVAEG